MSSPYSLSPVFRNRTKVLTFSTSDMFEIDRLGSSVRIGVERETNLLLLLGGPNEGWLCGLWLRSMFHTFYE